MAHRRSSPIYCLLFSWQPADLDPKSLLQTFFFIVFINLLLQRASLLHHSSQYGSGPSSDLSSIQFLYRDLLLIFFKLPGAVLLLFSDSSFILHSLRWSIFFSRSLPLRWLQQPPETFNNHRSLCCFLPASYFRFQLRNPFCRIFFDNQRLLPLLSPSSPCYHDLTESTPPRCVMIKTDTPVTSDLWCLIGDLDSWSQPQHHRQTDDPPR